MTRAEERALRAYPVREDFYRKDGILRSEPLDLNLEKRGFYRQGYEQAEKDIKEVIVKHFKYKQDHSPEHTLHWWVYKNVIDKVNEL